MCIYIRYRLNKNKKEASKLLHPHSISVFEHWPKKTGNQHFKDHIFIWQSNYWIPN